MFNLLVSICSLYNYYYTYITTVAPEHNIIIIIMHHGIIAPWPLVLYNIIHNIIRQKRLIIILELFFRVAGNVSAVFTYKWKGEDMARMLDDITRTVIVKITIASHCTKPYGNINR